MNLVKKNSSVWVPYDHRPVKRFRNVQLRQRHVAKPDSYYVGIEGNSVTLVYDHELIEFAFDDNDALQSQIGELDALGIRRVSFLGGAVKVLFTVTAFIAFLKIVIWISN